MRKYRSFFLTHIYAIAIAFTGLLLSSFSARAQCYENFDVYKIYPYGLLCSPQTATLRAEYYTSGSPVEGEFRWYANNEPRQIPLQTNYISSWGLLTADYSVFANNGTSVWVSFYNYNTGCESYRTPYTFYVSSTPSVIQEYAKKCRNEVAKVQLSSNLTGVTFQLYKLFEYYDPVYGTVQDYQMIQSNSTGYFEITGFNPGEADKYYAKAYHPSGCSMPFYYQLWFDVITETGPSVTGNLSVTQGSSTTLTASGTAPYFKWYDAGGSLIFNGSQFPTPTTLEAGTHTYQAKGVSSDGTCLTDPTLVVVSVVSPPVTYTPLFTSSNFTKTIDLARPVGTVAGSPGTTSSGGVSYSIPVYAPPGTNGMQPSVNVTYNSQGSSGIAGWGWNISGLSVISRTGKNIYHDGIAAPLTYTSSDAFLLDGMRLNAITGSNGDNGTIYAAEAESFAKIISYTTSSANNPDWFKVTAKDGSIMEFGNTADSRVMTNNGANVMLWRLNRVQDINGNYIDFVYDNNLRDSRIKTIKYTGNINTGLLPYNSISFNYKLRTDKNTGYDAGGSLSSQHLLDKITVTVDDNTVVKNYQFNYGFDNVNSLLKEVVESADDGTSLNSTIFLYGENPQDIITVSEVGNNFTGSKDFVSGDFDGDGKTDLLAADFYLNNGFKYHTGFSTYYDFNDGTPYFLYGESLLTGDAVNFLGGNKASNFLTSDYNGDGRDDILVLNTPIDQTVFPNKRILNKTRINYTGSYNTATGTTTITKENILFPTVWESEYKYIHEKSNFFIPGDFDGDGNQDFITILAKSRTVGSPPSVTYYFDYKAFISSPATQEINKEIGNFGFGPDTYLGYYAVTVADADLINVFDFDGDGKMEILVTKDQQSYVLAINRILGSPDYFTASVVYTSGEITKDSKIFPGDFNGDRKTDFLVKNSNGIWKIVYSTGTAFTASVFTFNQAITYTGDPIYDHKLVVSDFNGDGRSDIMHGFALSGSSASNFSLYYSKGKDAGFYNDVYYWSKSLLYGDITIGDFNGDGRTDVLRRENINSKLDFISFRPYSQERLLKKVTDGHNTTSGFEYKLLTDKSTYPYFYNRTVSLDDPANKNPYNYIQLPLYAVSSITIPDGIGGNNTTAFEYEDAVIHRAAKGFLGFKKVTAKNAVTGITSVTENEINTQFAVPYNVKQTTLLTATGELLSETQATNTFTSLSTGNGDIRYLQKVDKMLSIDHLNGRASESVNTYDIHGNITINVSKAGVLSGTTVTATETATTTTVYGTHNTPVPARPTSITVANLRTGRPSLSSTTLYTYIATGLVASKKDFNGLAKAVTTAYTYNGFGNPLTAVISSTGLTSRTVTNVYDTKGRFVLNKTNSGGGLSQTESYTYSSQWGKPLSQISGDCLTTSFEYDIFGGLKKTTFPQGFSMNSSLVWDVSGDNVYYILTDYPGGSPDTKTWYDMLGRETKTQTAGFGGQWLTRQTTYNAKGQAVTQTNDYYTAETPLTTTLTYDVYGRPISSANTLATVTNTYTKLSNGQVKVAVTSSGQTTSKTTDAAGRVITATDNGGSLTFVYDSRGNQTQVKHGSTVLITSVFDIYGRQTSLSDKNAGLVTYVYDAYGQLTQQTDAKGNSYTMLYDGLGRITSRTGPEGATTYEYYTAGSCSNNSPVKITGFNGVKKEYTYDPYNRPATEKVTIDGTAYTTSFTYNTYNALTRTVYPSGIEENRTYDANGSLLTVTGGNAGSPVTLFTATAVNGFGQFTGYTLGNGKTAQHTYHYGTPTRYYTAGVQDLNFTWDYTKGNLLTRQDAIKNITEDFTFDNLNRLTTSTVNGTQQFSITYDGDASSSMGNIITKTDAGNYVYKTDKIHAVAYITNPAGAQTPPANISTIEQQLTYTPFLKTATVTEAPYGLDFTYGPDYERVKTLMKNNNVLQETRLYLGSYEKQIIAGGATREIHYIGGGNGLCAILVKESGTVTPYYVYTDHLGSILTITNAAGTVTTEQNFDAWGRKRNPANWQNASVPATAAWLYRGYTGHEHLPQFALINMNGRIYDPIQGRMLSPDNYVPTPFGTQGYNRYGYANNNPLSYIDPDGNLWFMPIIMGAVKGAAIASTIYFASNFIDGGTWKNLSAHDWGRAAGMGAFGGAIGGGFSMIGQSIGPAGQSMAFGIMQNMATHLAVDVAFGNKITAGSVFGTAMGGIIDGTIPQFKGIPFKKYGFGAGLVNALAEMSINTARGGLIGGISSAIGGGSFQQGARSGAVGGLVRTGINLAVLGPTIRPTGDIKTALSKMETDLGINLTGAYGPTYRAGGLLTIMPNLGGIASGRSLMISNKGIDCNYNAWVHESFHYYQQLTQGWAGQFMRGIHEQWWMYPIQGHNPYLTWGTNEFGARIYENSFINRLQ